MVSFPTIEVPGGGRSGQHPERAFNRVEHHDLLVQAYEPLIKAAARRGSPT